MRSDEKRVARAGDSQCYWGQAVRVSLRIRPAAGGSDGSSENAAVVRHGYEAFNAGDINALNKMFDESAVWHAPGHTSLAGDHEVARRPSPTWAG